MRPTPARLAALALAAMPLLAAAHVGADGAAHHDGFLSGFTHPFTGLDHLAAMVAVGLWSALTTPRATAWALLRLPLAFAMLLLVGALAARAGLALPAIEPLIASSVLVLGLLVALQVRLPALAGALLVGVFALFHGAAHGQELASGTALAGMLLATAVLHAAGLGLGWWLRRLAATWAPRVAGGAVALFGAGLLLSL